jgi:hypothetical protein
MASPTERPEAFPDQNDVPRHGENQNTRPMGCTIVPLLAVVFWLCLKLQCNNLHSW